MTHPTTLKAAIGRGLLSFPVTPFNKTDAAVDVAAFRSHIERLSAYPAAALFVAGGTGEFFSLTPEEIVQLVEAAKDVAGPMPIIAGCGYGTPMAVDLARQIEKAGADGLLLLPHYLIGAEQEGIYHHIKQVCDSVSIGVIVYGRDNSVLSPATLQRLSEVCPNLIGYKDGHGNIELVTRICVTLGDRLTYIGGMPTAEVYAKPYKAAGVSVYSSAVFNFVPKIALEFFDCLNSGDIARVDHLLRAFYYPLIDLRNRRKGYAVSIIKAGMRLTGHDPGPVRAPITDLTVAEHTELASILEAAFGMKLAA
jgi:5-dehydro-4-deoxyglucarate dehydratase